MKLVIGRSSGLLSVEHLPIPCGTVAEDPTVVKRETFHEKAYSYGDSAGITPDFPFNGAHAPTNHDANVMDCCTFKVILDQYAGKTETGPF